MQQERKRQCTTRGAVVREFPPTRDAARQTERRTRTVGVQVEIKRSIGRKREDQTATKRPKVRETKVQVWPTRSDLRERGVQAGADESRGPREKIRGRSESTTTARRLRQTGESERGGEVRLWLDLPFCKHLPPARRSPLLLSIADTREFLYRRVQNAEKDSGCRSRYYEVRGTLTS